MTAPALPWPMPKGWTPPSVVELPPAVWETALAGAAVRDVQVREWPYMQNVLAHALGALWRAGWLRGEPDQAPRDTVREKNARLYELIPWMGRYVAERPCPRCDAQPGQDCMVPYGSSGVHVVRIAHAAGPQA